MIKFRLVYRIDFIKRKCKKIINLVKYKREFFFKWDNIINV